VAKARERDEKAQKKAKEMEARKRKREVRSLLPLSLFRHSTFSLLQMWEACLNPRPF